MQKKWSLFDGNDINPFGFDWAVSLLQDKVIVIADDNNSVLKWLKFSLEDYGVKVYVFEHGADTIAFLKDQKNKHLPVDLLILDILMNEVGGIEIAKFSKNIFYDSKIMFLTGCQCTSSESITATGLGLVVQKPVGLEDVVSRIMTIFMPDWENSYQDFQDRQMSF